MDTGTPTLNIHVSRDRTESEDAIVVSHVSKTFGSGTRACHVLHDYEMTVKKGTIYALLGASGCGKTTLLSCIVGMNELDAGVIHIFGHPPKTPGLGVPGSRIGYMPQELALNMEFSIEEVVNFYGRVHGMTQEAIKQRLAFLMTFLQLPHKTRLIHTLSGGQQRRVSFAIALLHEPEMLILDEPTVGVDPLLRQMIWLHLRDLTSKGNCTVLLTTHYLEEARHAHMVGLMRSGHLLAQDSPAALIVKHGCSNLEEVFLDLCVKDERVTERGPRVPRKSLIFSRKSFSLPKEERIVKTSQSSQAISCYQHYNHIRAVILMIFVRQRRMWLLSSSYVLLPAFLILFSCILLGGDPKGLKMAVVNHEWPQEPICQVYDDCLFLNLSCRFLQSLDHKMITLMPYEDESSAMMSVAKGDAWGVITFPETYSDSLANRVLESTGASNETLQNSVVKINMDMSNQQIGYMVQRMLSLHFAQFTKQILEICSMNTALSSLPVVFGEAILGSNSPYFQDFLVAGLLININFSFSAVLGSVNLVMDRSTGISNRVAVSGIAIWEMLTSNLMAMNIFTMLQALAMILTLYVYLQLPILSTFPLIVLLVFMQGSMGLVYGVLVSVFSSTVSTMVFIILSTLFPVLLSSGTFWPIEGVAFRYMKWFCWMSPTTWATEATKSMMVRGWGITYWKVWLGFVTTIGWTLLFMFITFVALKCSRKKLLV